MRLLQQQQPQPPAPKASSSPHDSLAEPGTGPLVAVSLECSATGVRVAFDLLPGSIPGTPKLAAHALSTKELANHKQFVQLVTSPLTTTGSRALGVLVTPGLDAHIEEAQQAYLDPIDLRLDERKARRHQVSCKGTACNAFIPCCARSVLLFAAHR